MAQRFSPTLWCPILASLRHSLSSALCTSPQQCQTLSAFPAKHRLLTSHFSPLTSTLTPRCHGLQPSTSASFHLRPSARLPDRRLLPEAHMQDPKRIRECCRSDIMQENKREIILSEMCLASKLDHTCDCELVMAFVVILDRISTIPTVL